MIRGLYVDNMTFLIRRVEGRPENARAVRQRREQSSRYLDLTRLATSPLESTEEVVSCALRCMARIKLNRYDSCIATDQQLTLEVRGSKTQILRIFNPMFVGKDIVILIPNHSPVLPLPRTRQPESAELLIFSSRAGHD